MDGTDPSGRRSAGSAVAQRRHRVPIAGAMPFGLGAQKPHHFLEMARTIWENRDALPYAYRVLTDGVCDGCALGTSGVHDWTLGSHEGQDVGAPVHLCLVRLGLLRTNTIGPLDVARLADVDALTKLDGRELRELGRIPVPMRRRRGERGFSPVSWDEALADLGARMRACDPNRLAAFLTARGIGNEIYYVAQKAVRAFGSPHVDNAARLCHSPSTSAMKRMLGISASTCSYHDWYGSELVVLFGSNPANDQPVAMKYLHEAKERGTRVLAVNTFDEPGLDRYWIPSTAGSALFGTRICDRFYRVGTGGDLAFLRAVTRVLVETGAIDHAFLDAHTEGFEAYRESLLADDMDALVAESGASRQDVQHFAAELANAKTAVFVWSMGLTQHGHGSATVEALLALGLVRGYVGREKCGLMPIRGHSGVQGGGEMGAYSNLFPGGRAITAASADALEEAWGFRPPAREGLDSVSMMEAAERGELDVFYCLGGNLRDTLPQPRRVEAALAKIPTRIHQDLVLTHTMLVEPSDVVYLLPARTRYESRGGITETTTERRVVFSPFIEGHELPEAKEEWWIARALFGAAHPDRLDAFGCESAEAIRAEIARVIPMYAGIEKLAKKGDQFQWGGARLCEGGVFPTPSGRASFHVEARPVRTCRYDELRLATRRGKQFNSMVHDDVDPLTGASRDHVLMSDEDMRARGLEQDTPIAVTNEWGRFEGRAYRARILPGNVQMFWPEANPLLAAGRVDPRSHVPDYNALVRIERRS